MKGEAFRPLNPLFCKRSDNGQGLYFNFRGVRCSRRLEYSLGVTFLGSTLSW
ncbi:hypothetical protein GCM10007116_10120 [Sulfodiicoccus acidiphilus]|uniref:Uncharacterized protein n=1 Tax=Sulfodiicoccus acidiphilus TaxID=1670455 RepID=A0A830H271_9CREN|nr:hypothetical protein GCM10007116_10120 [Sulfodiicoccus acidiphilus]